MGYLSTVEVHVSVICTCMPAIRNLLRRWVPGIMGHTRAGTYGNVRASTTGLSTGFSGKNGGGSNKWPLDETRPRDSDEIDLAHRGEVTRDTDTDCSNREGHELTEPQVRVTSTGLVVVTNEWRVDKA
jgi:hypothetical protein